MNVVYVAGPYRSGTIAGVRANIESARRVAEVFWRIGYAVICPHLNSGFMDGIVADEDFLEGDLEILRRCNQIVMAPGWERSAGARGELEVARECGLVVCFWSDTEGIIYEA